MQSNLCTNSAVTKTFITLACKELESLPHEIIVDLVDENIGGFTEMPNMVEVFYIGVPRVLQGQGYGSTVLRVLTTLADQLGVILVLTVAMSEDDCDWPMSSYNLVNWYERYGFVGDRKMIREPRR